jgi:hypothetical protein
MGKPEQLLEECKGLGRDRQARDTSTKRQPRSTTSRAEGRASRDTSGRRAKRRYRADESRRAKQVSAERKQAAPQPTIQKAAELESFFSLFRVSWGFLEATRDGLWAYPRNPIYAIGRSSIKNVTG